MVGFMEDQNIILRHVTPIENIPSILHEGKLSALYTLRRQSSDRRYISFEVYTGSTFLEQLCRKKSNANMTFSLFFRKSYMLDDGIVFKCGQGFPSKIENIVYVNQLISQEEYEQIGDYIFVEGEVLLKYLTGECKSLLRTYAKEENIQFNEDIFH